MKRLFILGNGFDLAHFLPTRYDDFRKFLIEQYPNSANITPTFNISSYTMSDGEEVYNHDEAVSFLMHIISNAEEDGDYWCDIESSLGNLEFEEFFDEISYLFDDEDEDDNFHRDDAFRREDASRNFRMVTLTIQDYFSEWIDTIDITDVFPKSRLQNLISDGDNIFLNFNYTKVLENTYGIKDVAHIHGVVNGDIIIGHGVDHENGEEDDINFELERLHELLRKPTDKIIQRHQSFFEKLSNVNEIYSYGFSFSDVDLPYIERICKQVDSKNVIWYLSSFKPEEHEEFKAKIIDCGFKGTFGIFDL